jgi:hypothetical protein
VLSDNDAACVAIAFSPVLKESPLESHDGLNAE